MRISCSIVSGSAISHILAGIGLVLVDVVNTFPVDLSGYLYSEQVAASASCQFKDGVPVTELLFNPERLENLASAIVII